ncbi:class I adenylate-forming enzyme family protein [Sporosarcina beigongshangi]|uniref:class I adenylate-forming enzyme family protein n=1 Tax=Sporosarcina beigongshangi TaxID=2782538 RepID=UPI0019395225|nr:AMP-binding protein [Sporosarcina beigongshangi]
MNSSQLLARNARKYPLTEAVVGMGKRYSYQELDRLVNQFAHGLRRLEIEQGDRVVLYMPNAPEFAIAYFAVQRLGAIIVPINARMTLTEIDYVLNDSRAKALIVHDLLFEAVKELSSQLLLIKTGEVYKDWTSFGVVFSEDDTAIDCHLAESAESTILYTSGTTGQPKGVLFSYKNILTVAQMICVEMEIKPESRLLIMMPLSHSAPLHLLFMAGLIVGATSVLTPTFTPDLLIDMVEQERTTHFFGAPVAYLLTAKHPKMATANLSSMKWWIYGGAPLSKPEVEFVQQAFQTDNLVCVYGLTEAGPNGTLLSGSEHATKAGSIGKRAALHAEIKVANAAGEEVKPGEVGEILLRGEGNMIGYYNNEQATAETYFGDWLKTGDLARVDEEGYIWIVDRKKDLIISGGVNIYPKEVEDVLVTHPSISEVAVVGVPHPEWGETVKAYFAASEQLDWDEVKQFAEGKLAHYKVPRLYEQVEALPRNASGKILKQPLRKRDHHGTPTTD